MCYLVPPLFFLPLILEENPWELEQRCFSTHKPHAGCRNWPWSSNSSEWGTKHVFLVNLLQISSAIPEISAENPVSCTWWPWPWHSYLSERDIFPVNLAQIHSAVPDIFDS